MVLCRPRNPAFGAVKGRLGIPWANPLFKLRASSTMSCADQSSLSSAPLESHGIGHHLLARRSDPRD